MRWGKIPMPELFVAMFREEWRMHSTIFGSLGFALFPVLVAAITFMGSAMIPYLEAVIPGGTLSLVVHLQFLLLGVMVGGFGLLGQEVMNRRFGQASLLAYSSRSLPISDRRIFATFVAKDTVYYFLLWVLPFIAGVAFGIPLSGLSISFVGLITVTLTLSFLFGLALVFLLSMLYAKSPALLAFVLSGVILIAAGIVWLQIAGTVYLFPPYALYRDFSAPVFCYAILAIALPFSVSISGMTLSFSGREKRYTNQYGEIAGRLGGLPAAPLVAKDILDLWRSGAFVGQVLFSFLFPLAVIWVSLSVLSAVLPDVQILFSFAAVAGVIAATMYTWLTEFDSVGTYTFLPLGTPDLIQSKFTSFSVLQTILVLTIAVTAILSGHAREAFPAVVLAVSVSFYACSVMIYLTGLWPAVMVYNARVLLSSLLMIGPVLLVFIWLSLLDFRFAFSAVFLALPAYLLVRISLRRWASWEKVFF